MRVFKINYIFLSALLTVFLLTACTMQEANNDSLPDSATTDQQSDIDEIYEVYMLYQKAGGNMSYDEWLATIKGEKGDPGSSILIGTSEPSNSSGNNGDVFINTTNWDVYTKNNGLWSKIGNILGGQGLQGIPGKDGYSVLTGNGEPACNLGKNGDSYINLENFDYYVKENNTWIKKGNIKGADATTNNDVINLTLTGSDEARFLCSNETDFYRFTPTKYYWRYSNMSSASSIDITNPSISIHNSYVLVEYYKNSSKCYSLFNKENTAWIVSYGQTIATQVEPYFSHEFIGSDEIRIKTSQDEFYKFTVTQYYWKYYYESSSMYTSISEPKLMAFEDKLIMEYTYISTKKSMLFGGGSTSWKCDFSNPE